MLDSLANDAREQNPKIIAGDTNAWAANCIRFRSYAFPLGSAECRNPPIYESDQDEICLTH